jgi:hypothetical protein
MRPFTLAQTLINSISLLSLDHFFSLRPFLRPVLIKCLAGQLQPVFRSVSDLGRYRDVTLVKPAHKTAKRYTSPVEKLDDTPYSDDLSLFYMYSID